MARIIACWWRDRSSNFRCYICGPLVPCSACPDCSPDLGATMDSEGS